MSPPELDPVLVAVGHAATGAGVRAGASEARRTHRPLVLVHVAPLGDTMLRMVGRDALREAQSLGREEVRDRTTCEHELIHGDPVEQLCRRARGGVLLVVERSEGGRHLGRHSTTVRLAETVEIPLLVVPAGWTPRHRSVVSVGLDPRAPDDTALRLAVVRARLAGSVLRVVVVGESTRPEVEARLDRAGADACDTAVEWDHGSAVGALMEAALDSDLVVLGRHAPTPLGPDGDVSGVGHLLVNHLACPVLLAPPGHVHEPAPHDPAAHDRPPAVSPRP